MGERSRPITMGGGGAPTQAHRRMAEEEEEEEEELVKYIKTTKHRKNGNTRCMYMLGLINDCLTSQVNISECQIIDTCTCRNFF